MTSTEKGCGDPKTIISLPSAPPEQPNFTLSLASPTLPAMVATNVDASYRGSDAMPQYDESIAMMMNADGLTWPQNFDHHGLPLGDHNYELCPPPSSSYLDIVGHSEPDCSSYNANFPLQTQFFGPDIDLTRPRSCPDIDSLGRMATMHDAAFSPFTSTVSPYQVHQHITPTSEPYIHIQEDDYEPSAPHQDILESIEQCGTPEQPHILMHSNQRDETTSHQSTTPFGDEMPIIDDNDMDADKSEPYAKSLFRCLRQAPNHTMVLRDIYDWFRANTDKGKDPHEKGWQNSIRHNLSMNKAFQKMDLSSGEDPSKKGYKWRLSDTALKDGRVQSTTRYRNKQPNKRGSKSHNPAPHRQASGARGGEMARRAAQVRRSERLREIRNSIQETGSLLRSRGVIRGNNTISGISSTIRGSPPRSTTLDYLASDAMNMSHSGPSSPYFLSADDPYPASQPAHHFDPTMNLFHRSPATNHDSYPSSPELGGVPDMHFMPIGDRLFYDSPESASEPRTPSAFSDMHMDPTPFFGNTDEMQF